MSDRGLPATIGDSPAAAPIKGFCQVLPAPPRPGYDHLVRFFVEATGVQAVTIRIRGVEQVLCGTQNADGGTQNADGITQTTIGRTGAVFAPRTSGPRRTPSSTRSSTSKRRLRRCSGSAPGRLWAPGPRSGHRRREGCAELFAGADATYTGTVTHTGETGRFRHVKGSGTIECTTTDGGAHKSCTVNPG